MKLKMYKKTGAIGLKLRLLARVKLCAYPKV
jgi:hypothetical protein